jgi:hypothetical protein
LSIFNGRIMKCLCNDELCHWIQHPSGTYTSNNKIFISALILSLKRHSVLCRIPFRWESFKDIQDANLEISQSIHHRKDSIIKNEQMKEMCYMYTMVYYSVIKKNELCHLQEDKWNWRSLCWSK